MGYIPSATTTQLIAKLTTFGRTQLIQNSSSLITSFSLGDSDANYGATLPLLPGQVPSNSGGIGANNSVSNGVSTNPNANLKSLLFVNSTGVTKKLVEPMSSAVTVTLSVNGISTASGTNLTQNIVNRNNSSTDPLVNLYSSFNLPLNSAADYTFTGLTSNFGGYANTSVSGIDQTNILVIAIDPSTYGEIIDGKTIQIQITTTAATYTLYSTYQNTGVPLTTMDAAYNDPASNTQFLAGHVAFLFSDGILKPNGGNAALSWATGYNTTKPFSQHGKQLYNFSTNSNLGQTADTIVGIAYLTKGFIVITHPTIVNNFALNTNTSVSFTSLSNVVTQNITCIANRGEFGGSTNPTFATGDTCRISEVGLYDNLGNLIAVAKTDRHILKNVNDFFALGIKIFV